MSLLGSPHHDGSPLYLDDDSPALGSTLKVRMRVAASDPATRVWVRTTWDAEPVFYECQVIRKDEHALWWQGDLPVRNPVANYRFLLADAAGNQRWLTAAGVADYDVSDTFDFKVSSHAPAPEWARRAVVYQIFPDRFGRGPHAGERPVPPWAVPAKWDDTVAFEGSDPTTPIQFFGGDLDGVQEHLDHIEAAGASVVYLTPVFPGDSNHRYNASTFDQVDPLLGGDEAYARLSKALHARGLQIIGDLTSNHTGDTHEWFLEARSGETSRHRDWYYFHPDGSYESWMGHYTLPKLNHLNAEMRAAMVEGPDSIVARWLRPPFEIDGWRIDVANMTGRLGPIDVNHDVARAIRRTSETERSDAWVIGEHNHDASGDIDGDGWHGTMNYSGFSWPVWSWLRAEETPARPFGRPITVPRRSGTAVHRELAEWRARYGWRAAAQSWNILGSHDSARIRTVTQDAALHRVAAGLQFTLPGVPMVFAGDEIGLEGVNGEDSRRPMPWQRPDSWDHATLAAYGALGALRRSHPALVEGGLRWAHVDEDAMVYLREHPDGGLVVCARRRPGPAILLDAGQLGLTDGSLLLATEGEGAAMTTFGPSSVVPAATTPGVWIWRL